MATIRRVLLRNVGREAGHRESRQRGDAVLVLLGFAFVLVGGVDLILLWIPPRFDSLAWEFATVGGTLDGFPLSALGLGLVAFGHLRERRTSLWRTRLLAAVFGVVTVLLLAAAALLLTAAPSVLSETPTDALDGVRRAVVRHIVQCLAYPVAFGLIAGLLWRTGRAAT